MKSSPEGSNEQLIIKKEEEGHRLIKRRESVRSLAIESQIRIGIATPRDGDPSLVIQGRASPCARRMPIVTGVVHYATAARHRHFLVALVAHQNNPSTSLSIHQHPSASLSILKPRLVSLSIPQHPSTSLNIHQHPSACYNVLDHPSTSPSILQHPSTSHNAPYHPASHNIHQHLATSFSSNRPNWNRSIEHFDSIQFNGGCSPKSNIE